MLSTAIVASAQYSNIANGLTNVLMPALSGSNSYKGFVDVAYTQGVGRYRSNFATISTSQGYQLNSWLFMGAGIGVDLMWSYVNDDWGNGWSQSNMDRYDDTYVSKAVMIPNFYRFPVQYRTEERGIVLYRPEDRRLFPGQQQVGEDPQRVSDQHQLLLLPARHRRQDSRKLAEHQAGFQHRRSLPPPDLRLLERLSVQHRPERPRRAPRLRMVIPALKQGINGFFPVHTNF